MPTNNLASESKIVTLLTPAADGAGRASKPISLKFHTYVTILALIAQGNAAPVTLTLMQAKDKNGLDAKPLAATGPIWANQDAANLDTLVRSADGVSFTTSAAVADKQVAFHIDPSALDVNNGYAYVSLVTSASNAANITSAIAIAQGSRYLGGNAPSMLA